MQKLVTSSQIREHESEYIKKMGLGSSLELMEKAGKGLARIVKNYDEPYMFICGKGNNGGDGITASKYLHKLKRKVVICLTSSEQELSYDAKINFDLVKKTKIQYFQIQNESDKAFLSFLKDTNTVVDCLLGTGTSSKSKLSTFYEWIINSVNNSGKNIIACDISTGVDPSSGNISSCAIKAKETVTFGYPKIGLYIYPGREYSGKINVVDIGLPDKDINLFLLDDEFANDNLPQRANDKSKGSFGRTLVVAGSMKYPGAAILASKAASSIGSGLTCLATSKEVFVQITSSIPEVIHVEFKLDEILSECKKSNVVVLGPGLTLREEIKTLVCELITNAEVPIVLDADGISVLASKKEILRSARNHMIITPHLKEFARLLGKDLNEVLSNKLKLAQDASLELGCTVVLKGPGTIIAAKDGKTYISPFANSALAKGGTGDVLAGYIGGLIAQGLEPPIAACVGVYLHGKVAEIIAGEKTKYSLLPQDLITYLPKAIKSFESL
ncbi:MAG: NAD(P)H-hydrate dehydratase [Candidatus Melainabacteria bacterium]|nr:NAD(P)H-hydrate dehydratase [Candidatus Melainabacteria bacterium]